MTKLVPRLSTLAVLVCAQAAWAAPSQSKVRESAQRGLRFLAQSAVQWQDQHNCYGCHVQAVTLEALSVGRHHQYEVPEAAVKAIVEGMLELHGGAREPGGLNHAGYPHTPKTFGGAAFARYDQHVDSKLRDDLLTVARQLLEFQQRDGRVAGDENNFPPVTVGDMQATLQALQTWRQAYARTADDAWLGPIRRGERHILETVKRWEGNPRGVYLQDVNYALMGLIAAGVGRSEESVARLVAHLESRQRPDGSWELGPGSEVKGASHGWRAPGGSPAFATGQTVYALKLAGRTEGDRSVSRGLSWLVEHQGKAGGWSSAGNAKAEALWAVLGLVSVDVLTVAVDGVQDGQRVAPTHELSVKAADNQGGEVAKVRLLIDDVLVKEASGGVLTFTWKTKSLADGKHTVDAVAFNAAGQASRRRLEVYAGNVFLTGVGTRFGAEGTEVSLRNIAPADRRGSVRLRIAVPDPKDPTQPGRELYSRSSSSAPGPMSFGWSGKDAKGAAQPEGRYLAEVSFVDEKGATLQRELVSFTHATPELARKSFGEVGGQLSFAEGEVAANAEVELVDSEGRVMQRATTNESGSFRFKGVDEGEYQVRFRKQGFRDAAVPVRAEPARESRADVTLH